MGGSAAIVAALLLSCHVHMTIALALSKSHTASHRTVQRALTIDQVRSCDSERERCLNNDCAFTMSCSAACEKNSYMECVIACKKQVSTPEGMAALKDYETCAAKIIAGWDTPKPELGDPTHLPKPRFRSKVAVGSKATELAASAAIPAAEFLGDAADMTGVGVASAEAGDAAVRAGTVGEGGYDAKQAVGELTTQAGNGIAKAADSVVNSGFGAATQAVGSGTAKAGGATGDADSDAASWGGSSVRNAASATFGGLNTAGQAAGNGLESAASWGGGAVRDATEAVDYHAQAAAEAAGRPFATAANWIGTDGVDHAGGAAGGVMGGLKAAGQLFGGAAKGVGGMLGGAAGGLGGAASSVAGGAGGLFGGMMSGLSGLNDMIGGKGLSFEAQPSFADLEACVGCQFVWSKVYNDVGKTDNLDAIMNTFEAACQDMPDIFYESCDDMVDQKFFLASMYAKDPKKIKKICDDSGICGAKGAKDLFKGFSKGAPSFMSKMATG